MIEALKPCPFCGKTDTLRIITAQQLAEEHADYDGEFWEHSDSWAAICDAHKPGGPGGCDCQAPTEPHPSCKTPDGCREP